MYMPTISGALFGKHQRVEVVLGAKELFQKVEIRLQASPAKVVVKVPQGMRLVKISGSYGEVTELPLNGENEWETKVQEVEGCGLYCVPYSFKAFAAGEEFHGFRAPCNVTVKAEETREIPARVAVCIDYRPELYSANNFVSAFAQTRTLSYEELHDSILEQVTLCCEPMKERLAARPLTEGEIVEVVKEADLRDEMERAINGNLNEKGIMMTQLSFRASEIFNRPGSTAWTDYQESRELRQQNTNMKEKMKGDAELLKMYADNREIVRQMNAKDDEDEADKKKKGKK